MKRLGLVKASTLSPFIRYLRRNGIDLTTHLNQAHIPLELVQQEDQWLTKQQIYKFLTDVASAHEMDALGLVVGDQICVADLGDLGAAIYQCTTLEEACTCFSKLVPKFAEGNTASIEIHGTKTWFTYQTTDHLKGNRDHADHYGMMMLLSVVRLVAGRWYPDEVQIQTGACEAFSTHPGWENCRVTFDAGATGFAFPSTWLDRPLPDPPAKNLDTHSQDIYSSNPPTTLSRSLEIILGAYINIGGMPSLDRLAASLNMSERTLKRRLHDEGTTYSRLSERIRIEAAHSLLKDCNRSVKEVAYMLGYSGANNFIRAYKRETGSTPGACRKRNS